MKYFTLNEYVQRPEEDESYLIDGMLPQAGRIMLMGPAKEGKSFLAIQMGLAIARGEEFMGRPVTQGRVLYLQYDTPDKLWLKRMRKLHKAGVLLSDNFIILDHSDYEYRKTINVLDSDHVEYLNNVVQDIQPNVVIIDTLRKLYDGNENDSAIGKQVFDQLNTIFENRAVIYIHHSHKLSAPPGQKVMARTPPRDAARGTSYFADEVDAIYMLLGSRLTSNCRFDEDIDEQLGKDSVTHLWTFPDAVQKKKYEENVRKLWATRKPGMDWLAFRKFVSHTIVDIPDHIMTRLEDELSSQMPSSSS